MKRAIILVLDSFGIGATADAERNAEGDRRVMTVFFSDIEGFTSISEQLTPKALVKLINHYLADMSTPIQEEEGIIDKFIGDAVMAFWGAPLPDEEHARHAVLAAFDMIVAVESLDDRVLR